MAFTTKIMMRRLCFIGLKVSVYMLVLQSKNNSIGQGKMQCPTLVKEAKIWPDHKLSLVSIWSSGLSWSSQLSQIMFRWSGWSYGNATSKIKNDLDVWDDIDCLDRVEFYVDNCVKFEANIWKCSQMTKTNGTIKGYPRNHHCYSSNRE